MNTNKQEDRQPNAPITVLHNLLVEVNIGFSGVLTLILIPLILIVLQRPLNIEVIPFNFSKGPCYFVVIAERLKPGPLTLKMKIYKTKALRECITLPRAIPSEIVCKSNDKIPLKILDLDGDSNQQN